MKTIKISERVHEDLKVFAAQVKDSMSDISDNAIMQYMAAREKFLDKSKKRKPKFKK